MHGPDSAAASSPWALRAEEPIEAHVELAETQPRDARELGVVEAKPFTQERPRPFEQLLPRLPEPARDADAVHFVDARDLLDRQAIAVDEPQDVPIARRERAHRL